MRSGGKVRDFWERAGLSKPAGSLVTHRDFYQVALEIDIVSSLLKKSDRLLDVGCGNGFSTSIYAGICRSAVGIDYAASMIGAARRRCKSRKARFEREDVLRMGREYAGFSAVVSTRCLINLSSWEEQKKALVNLHRSLARNGRLILVEGTADGRESLNRLRSAVGLKRMPPVWHNVDFDEKRLMPFLKRLFVIERDMRLGLYDVLTRVFYARAIAPKEPEYGTRFHRSAYELFSAASGDSYSQYSREFILVLRKRQRRKS